MAIGPVQLIVLGFRSPDFHGEIIAALERLRASDTVRVIDSLAVYKTADGEVERQSSLFEMAHSQWSHRLGPPFPRARARGTQPQCDPGRSGRARTGSVLAARSRAR